MKEKVTNFVHCCIHILLVAS